MRRFSQFTAWIIASLVLILGPSRVEVSAQQPPPAEPAAAVADTPLEIPDDPLVMALLETKPSEPRDVVRALLALDDLGHAAVGKSLLEPLLATAPSEEVLADLVDHFGSATLLRLARIQELQPQGEQFSTAAVTAAAKFDTDSERIARSILDLTKGTPRQKAEAQDRLLRGGSTASAALLAVLADDDRAADHAAVEAALSAGDERFVPPLLAALESDEPRVRLAAVQCLAAIRDFSQPEWFYHVAWSTDDMPSAEAARHALSTRFGRRLQQAAAARELLLRTEAMLASAQRSAGAANDVTWYWTWNPAAKAPEARSVSNAGGIALGAWSHLESAHRLAPDDMEIGRARAVLLLKLSATDAGDRQWSSAVEELRPDELESVLEAAMNRGNDLAAAQAATQLGKVGDATRLIFGRGTGPTPLVLALKSPAHNLRWAALQSVLALDPPPSFPGASYVAESVQFFVAARGKPRAVVAHRSVAEGQRLAGFLGQLGFETDLAFDARQLRELATRSPDVRIVVLDASFGRPTSEAAWEMLRSEPTATRIPIAIVATAANHTRATRLSARDPHSFVLISPLAVAELRSQLGAMRAELAAPSIDPETQSRAKEAVTALAASVAAGADSFDSGRAETLISALNSDELAPTAVAGLAGADSPEAQRALLALVARKSAELTTRERASQAFAESVAKHGVRLTAAEVLAQYDVYNLLQRDDNNGRRVLGAVLDAIELHGAYAEQVTPR